VQRADLFPAVNALESRRYFRYDRRPHEESEVARFEARLCEYFEVPHALAVSSGTTAIALGLLAAGVAPGSFVACPGFTFAATPSAILLAGCRPLLVECDEDLHMDLDDLRRKIDRVKAIVVVHMRGFASDASAIAELARQHDIPLIEDAVPALGAEHEGRKLGTFGTAGAFSTQSDKSLNTGEGGFLLCHDAKLYARAAILSGASEGRFKRHFAPGHPAAEISDLDYPLFNFRMDEIRGALACAEMTHLPLRLARLRENYTYVTEALGSSSALQIRRAVAPGSALGDALIFRLPDASPAEVGHCAAALREEGIDARALGGPEDTNIRCFWNWRFLFPGMSVEDIQALLPKSTTYLCQAIDIPLSPLLERGDCDDLIHAVRKVVRP